MPRFSAVARMQASTVRPQAAPRRAEAPEDRSEEGRHHDPPADVHDRSEDEDVAEEQQQRVVVERRAHPQPQARQELAPAVVLGHRRARRPCTSGRRRSARRAASSRDRRARTTCGGRPAPAVASSSFSRPTPFSLHRSRVSRAESRRARRSHASGAARRSALRDLDRLEARLVAGPAALDRLRDVHRRDQEARPPAALVQRRARLARHQVATPSVVSSISSGSTKKGLRICDSVEVSSGPEPRFRREDQGRAEDRREAEEQQTASHHSSERTMSGHQTCGGW